MFVVQEFLCGKWRRVAAFHDQDEAEKFADRMGRGLRIKPMVR